MTYLPITFHTNNTQLTSLNSNPSFSLFQIRSPPPSSTPLPPSTAVFKHVKIQIETKLSNYRIGLKLICPKFPNQILGRRTIMQKFSFYSNSYSITLFNSQFQHKFSIRQHRKIKFSVVHKLRYLR